MERLDREIIEREQATTIIRVTSLVNLQEGCNPKDCGLFYFGFKEDGAPGRTRTCDPLLRRQMLYPLSYGSRVFDSAAY